MKAYRQNVGIGIVHPWWQVISGAAGNSVAG